MQLVFATNNEHKLREIRQILGTRFSILSLEEIGCLDEVPENQDTLEGNACEKAHYVYEKYKLPCFADDTGLEVYALNMEPGVLSARYAGLSKDPSANMAKLLQKLKNNSQRDARFRTVISLILPGNEMLFEGIVEGSIITQPRGTKGFGYDPVFVPKGYDTTFAEMNAEEKNQISHRGRAIEKLADFLQDPGTFLNPGL
jgi:XTP/dITP diphosphohydrolase